MISPLLIDGRLEIADGDGRRVTRVPLADGREVEVLEHVWGRRYSGDLWVVAADVRPTGGVSVLVAERPSPISPHLRVLHSHPLEIDLGPPALARLAELTRIIR